MHTDKCGRDTERNVLQKEVAKKLKYKILFMEIRRMWNMKCIIVSLQVITGATGIATEGLIKVLKAISGKRSIDSLQNTAVLGTSHIIQKVLQSET